jgi:transcription elongation GreA/GreB family factor
MAIRHREPDRLAALVAQDPAEVVRITLRSYGPLNAGRLKEILVPAVLPEEDWKRFWDAARKDLKTDPLVGVPARRSEPIELRAAAEDYGDRWFAAFSAERDIGRIMELIREWERAGAGELTAGQRQILSDRLGFAVRGSEWARPERVARLLMTATRLGMPELPVTGGEHVAWHIDVAATVRRMLDEGHVPAAVSALSARDSETFLAYLREQDAERAQAVLLDALSDVSFAGLAVVLNALSEWGLEESCAERIRARFRARDVRPTLVGWACANLSTAMAWGVADLAELAATAIDVLGTACSGEDLRAQNQLVTLFADRAWLKAVLDPLDVVRRRDLLRRVAATRGIDATQQRSIMARIIKLYPELEATLADEEPRDAGKRRVTAWRSYNARREQHRRLVEIEIPRNSREIALARSYGDLSENHEYKAAKEHQAVLLRRRGEIEQDLKEVQGTDFEGLPHDRVGPGSCVDLQRADGSTATYRVLGEWDRDEELGIISSRSRLAELLTGRRPGDSVEIPVRDPAGAAAGMRETCRIAAVRPLDEEVRRWINGEAAVPAASSAAAAEGEQNENPGDGRPDA